MDDDLRKQWGETVRLLRKSLTPDGRHRPSADAPQMTQVDLARLCGVTQQTISSIEKGEQSPRDSLKVKLAIALRQDVRSVFPLPSAPIAEAVA